ncbi:hypothetical protein CN085_30350 [Sinorhizobium meliloti]|nr:hypothetical protein CN085_30350 [Sinorhizobium meliloti]
MGAIVLVPLHGYGSGSRRQLHNLSNTAAGSETRLCSATGICPEVGAKLPFGGFASTSAVHHYSP